MSKPANSLISTVMRHAWTLAVAEPLVLILLIALLTVPYVMIEYLVPEDAKFTAISFFSLFSLLFQIVAMHRTLARQGWIESRREMTTSFYPRAFWQSLIFGAGTIAGLLLLVLPGIFLIVRWSFSLSILLARDCGVVESLRESWHLTNPYFWPLFWVLLLSYAPFLCATLVIFLLPEATNTFWGLTLIESASAASILFYWYVQIAFYRHIQNVTDVTP